MDPERYLEGQHSVWQAYERGAVWQDDPGMCPGARPGDPPGGRHDRDWGEGEYVYVEHCT